MASSSPSVVLLFLISLRLAFTYGEFFNPLTSGPSTEDCDQSHLLPLAPCAPFVQGFDSSPLQICCDNLHDLYLEQPNCLCLLLNDTALSAFPINKTLALELPPLCNLQLNYSICLTSPGVALPLKTNMGLLYSRSSGEKLEIKESSMLLAATTLLLIPLSNLFYS